MRNLTFRGYAQSKGFDPLRVPDQTLKLQAETERTLRGMRKVQDQNNRNRTDYLQQLRSNDTKEATQDRINFGQRTKNEAAYQDAVLSNIKQKYTDAGIKAQEHERKAKQWQELKDLIPKAVSTYAQFDKIRFNEMVKVGARTFRELPTAAQEDWTKIREFLKEKDKPHNALREKYGIKEDLWHRITKQKGYTLYGANVAHIKDWFSNQSGIEYNNYSNNKKYITDEGHTLTQVLGNTKDITGIEARALMDGFKKSVKDTYFPEGTYSDELVREVVDPLLDEFIGKKKLELNQQVLNNKAKLANEIIQKEVVDYIKAGDTPDQGLMDFINNGGDRAVNWGTFDKAAKPLFRSGEWDRAMLNKLRNGSVTLDDGSKVQIGSHWSDRFNDLETEVMAKETEDRKLHIENRKNEGNQHHMRYLDFQDQIKRRLTAEEWDQHFDNQFKMDGWTKWEIDTYMPWVKAEKSRPSAVIEDDENRLNILLSQNKIKPAHLLTVDPSIRSNWIDKMPGGKNGIDKATSTRIYNLLKTKVKEVGGGITTVPDILDVQNQAIYIKAMQNVSDRLMPAIINRGQGVSAEDVLFKLVTEEMKDIEKGTGIYERETDWRGNQLMGAKGKWKYALDATGFDTVTEYKRVALSEPTRISQPGYLTNDHLNDLRQWVNKTDQLRGGRKPLFLEAIANADKTRSEFEVTRDILKAEYGVTITPKGPDKLLTYLPEDQRKHLRNKPSLGKTVEVFTNSPDNAKTVAQMEIPKDVHQFLPDKPHSVVKGLEGYKSINDLFGVDESHVTIENLLDAGNRGILKGFGAYNMDTSDLKRAVNSGFVTTTDFFSPELQDNLKLEMMYNESSVFYADKDHFAPIPGVGQDLGIVTKTSDYQYSLELNPAISDLLDFSKLHPVMYEHINTLTK